MKQNHSRRIRRTKGVVFSAQVPYKTIINFIQNYIAAVTTDLCSLYFLSFTMYTYKYTHIPTHTHNKQQHTLKNRLKNVFENKVHTNALHNVQSYYLGVCDVCCTAGVLLCYYMLLCVMLLCCGERTRICISEG